jgi:hypothetical protein
MELDIIIVSEIRQFHKHKYHIFSFVEMRGTTKQNKTKTNIMKTIMDY